MYDIIILKRSILNDCLTSQGNVKIQSEHNPKYNLNWSQSILNQRWPNFYFESYDQS